VPTEQVAAELIEPVTVVLASDPVTDGADGLFTRVVALTVFDQIPALLAAFGITLK
jgi:hypothetical protein